MLRSGSLSSHFIYNVPPAMKLGTVPPGKRIHFQVLTAGCTIRLAGAKEQLDATQPGIGPGFQFTTANGPVEMQWSGEVWAEGVPTNPTSPVEVTFGILTQ